MTRTRVTVLVPTQDCALDKLSTQLDAAIWESKDTIHAEPGTMLLWIAGDDTETINAALGADSSVATHTLVTDGTERRLYRIEWAKSAGIMTFLDVLHEYEGELCSVSGMTDSEWTLHFMIPDQTNLSEMHETCDKRGMQLKLTTVRDCDFEWSEGSRVTLTRPQYEALRTAYEHGYFEIPRKTKLEKLASKLEVSHQSLSELMRRAQYDLLHQTIFTDYPAKENGQKEAISLLKSAP